MGTVALENQSILVTGAAGFIGANVVKQIYQEAPFATVIGIDNKKSPIQNDYIEKYLAAKKLDLTATLDAREAYSDADFVVIAAPTKADTTYHTEVGLS